MGIDIGGVGRLRRRCCIKRTCQVEGVWKMEWRGEGNYRRERERMSEIQLRECSKRWKIQLKNHRIAPLTNRVQKIGRDVGG